MNHAEEREFVDGLHQNLILEKGDFFVRQGQMNHRIASIERGVIRGFVYDDENEVTIHFYQEGDVISGNFIPNVVATVNLQAIEKTTLSMANFSEVMENVNKNTVVTDIIHRSFEKMNRQLQSRLVSFSNLDSTERYKLFLKEYPNLINRIPHYLVANFLGITPTQLSRARKRFSQQM